MKIWHVAFIALFALSGMDCQEDYSILPPFLRWISPSRFLVLREFIANAIGRTASSARSLETANRFERLQRVIPNRMKFPCDVSHAKSSTVPTSVHKLRPGDISVIGAMGDSLTAGNGEAASNVFQAFSENRGLSWTIGGQGTWREYLTLPNILKEFNPNLVGYALGDALTTERKSQFNVAEAGAMTIDMGFMAKELVKRIKNDPRVNINEDWKLITILIGSNDYCVDICYQDISKVTEGRKKNLMEALDTFLENLPRTFVNLVASPNIAEILRKYKKLPPHCWTTLRLECPCLLGSRYRHFSKRYMALITEQQQLEMELSKLPKYNKDDFAVVTQTFTLNLKFPNKIDSAGRNVTDISYLSTDCFHFSQKGHARAANSLWNNMLEPVGQKSTNWRTEFEFFRCPSRESPYIFTSKNSKNSQIFG